MERMLSKRGLIRLLNRQIAKNFLKENLLSEKPLSKKELDEQLKESSNRLKELERLKGIVEKAPEW